MNMVYGQNTTLVTYKILGNNRNVALKVRPHFLFRDFHGNMFENEGIEKQIQVKERQFELQPFFNAPKLHARWDRGQFITDGKWHKDVYLQLEEDRGLPAYDDDFSCGYLSIAPFSGSASIIFSDQEIKSFNPMDLRKREEWSI